MESRKFSTIRSRWARRVAVAVMGMAMLLPVSTAVGAVGGGTWESGYDGAGYAFSNYFIGAYHGSSVDGNIGPLVRSACIKEYEWSYAKSRHDRLKSEVSRAYYRLC